MKIIFFIAAKSSNLCHKALTEKNVELHRNFAISGWYDSKFWKLKNQCFGTHQEFHQKKKNSSQYMFICICEASK